MLLHSISPKSVFFLLTSPLIQHQSSLPNSTWLVSFSFQPYHKPTWTHAAEVYDSNTPAGTPHTLSDAAAGKFDSTATALGKKLVASDGTVFTSFSKTGAWGKALYGGMAVQQYNKYFHFCNSSDVVLRLLQVDWLS